MTLRPYLLAGIALLALGGCSSKPAPDLYVLRAPASEAPRACVTTRDIVLERPTSPREYDTKRIAVMLDGNHLSYYTGASWASPFPDQLQDFLSDALAQRGLNIIDAGEAPHADSIHVRIREADVTDIDAPVVRLRLSGMAGSKRFTVNESVPAEQNHMPQIIDAYNEAASHAADHIVHALKWRCGVMAGD